MRQNPKKKKKKNHAINDDQKEKKKNAALRPSCSHNTDKCATLFFNYSTEVKKCPIAVVVFCHSVLMIMMIQARRMWWFANGLWLCWGGEEAAGKLLTREIDVQERLCICHIELLCIRLIVRAVEGFFYIYFFATWNLSSSVLAPAAAINSKISVCLLHGVSFLTDTRSR